jgi:2-oxoglutarate dehydrogenase E1 component
LIGAADHKIANFASQPLADSRPEWRPGKVIGVRQPAAGWRRGRSGWRVGDFSCIDLHTRESITASMSTLIEQFRQSSPLFGGNAAFIEELYESFLSDPESVSENWRQYFRNLHAQTQGARDVAHGPIRDSFARLARQPRKPAWGARRCFSPAAAEKQASVLRIINAYRNRGHKAADLDPLRLRERPPVPELDPGYHGLSEADMGAVVQHRLAGGALAMDLREILDLIRDVYVGTIGSEYMHINETAEKRWIQKRLEGQRARLDLDAGQRRELLHWLVAAEGLERYLHTRYVGQKRFSLEGGESLIPMMDESSSRPAPRGCRKS